MRIEKLAKAYAIETTYVHFPLHPDTPEEGRTLEALFQCGPEVVRQKNERMTELMHQEGLAYGVRTHTYNSRLAQELGKWADTQPGGDAIHDALFRAYFVDSRDLSQKSILLDIAEKVGLSRLAAQSVLDDRSFKSAVDEDWNKSQRYGVTGVPTYVAGRSGVVGAQPYEVLEQLVVNAGGRRRT